MSRGSCTAIQLPPDLAHDSTWLGLALCFVYIYTVEVENSNYSNNHCIKLHCQFITDEGQLTHPLSLPIMLYNCLPYGVCRYIPREYFATLLNKTSRIEASILNNIPIVKVKMCSAFLIYKHNAKSFVSNVMGSFYQNLDMIPKKKGELLDHQKALQTSATNQCESTDGVNMVDYRGEAAKNDNSPDDLFIRIREEEEEEARRATGTRNSQRELRRELQLLLSKLFIKVPLFKTFFVFLL